MGRLVDRMGGEERRGGRIESGCLPRVEIELWARKKIEG
jgi:hypothetical protein